MIFPDRGAAIVINPRFQVVRELLDRHLATAPQYYGTIVWVLMMLEQWLRVHAPDFRIDT